ncbi:MAG: menaquinone biosynthesis protein [Thermodesulfobacteriota bacterium]
MKLGYIDFLNCYPFYYHMFEKAPVPGVTVVPGYPGKLNAMMAAGDLDMGPISSATCADIHDDIMVLPDFCLSSIGYVGSVSLASQCPIEELDGKIVGVTSASHTSAVLLKTLLKKYYQADPTYVTTAPRPTLDGLDAALLIGNDAMVCATRPVPYRYDLGDLWLRKTGYPVVFAVFVVRQDAVKRFLPEIKAVIDSYHLSLDCLKQQKELVIRKAAQKYEDVLYDLDEYYKTLKFEFTDRLKAALMFYFEQAAGLGLIKTVKELKVLSD